MFKEQKPRFKNGLPRFHPGEFLVDDLEALQMSPAECDTALTAAEWIAADRPAAGLVA